MNKTLKRVGLTLAGVVALLVAAGAAGYVLGERKQQRQVDVPVAPLTVSLDTASLERGRYLFNSRGCAECHGANGGGHKMIDGGGMLVITPHISPGEGSVTAAYRVEDWVRAIRHGVKPDGRPLMVMPSADYNRFTDADTAALIAFTRQMPAVSGGAAVIELPPPVRILYGFGVIHDAAGTIDHSLPPSAPVAEGVTVEHGRYVAQMCVGCHGPGYAGGKIPDGPPDWPAAANLTPGSGSAMTRYPTADAFVAMMKSGKRPTGEAIAVMPFESLSKMNDVDLRGLHAYLLTLPARESGKR